MNNFSVPVETKKLMAEYVRGIIDGAYFISDNAGELLNDEWITWSDDFDINIFLNNDGDLVAAVHPVKLSTNPDAPGMRSTDGSQYVMLNLHK